MSTASRYLTLWRNLLELCPEEPLWVDVEAFEEAARAARRTRESAAYRAAVDLYAGDLLPEDLYEDWANHVARILKKLGLRSRAQIESRLMMLPVFFLSYSDVSIFERLATVF